jgi:quercetin dioxygenase-like cupin family protein
VTHRPHPLLRALLTADADGDDADVGALLDHAVAALPGTLPSASLRARLLASARADAGVSGAVARLFQVGLDQARAYLQRIDDPAAWSAFAPGSALMHLAGGPATATADVGFVRVADGATFPPHHHVGEERTVILRGVMVEADGRRLVPGDEVTHPPGSDHTFHAEGELIYAVVVFGVSFGAELDAALHA